MTTAKRISLVHALVLCLGGVAFAEQRPNPDALQAELQKLAGRDFRIHTAGVVAVVTDASDEVGALCIRHLYMVLPRMRGLARIPADAPPPAVVVVALFKNPLDFDKFVRARGGKPRGSYTYLHDKDSARRVVAGYVLAKRPMLARLRHAAFVKLLRAWISNPPHWLCEGLAECMEDVVLKGKKVELGPARGHIRDLREVLLAGRPEASNGLKDLVVKSTVSWEKDPFRAYSLAWGFCRFLLEEEEAHKEGLLPQVYQALSTDGTIEENNRLAAAVFKSEKWESLQKRWSRFVAEVQETPAEKHYRKAQEKLREKNEKDALSLLGKAIQQDSDYERIYYFRALAAYRIGKFRDAVVDLGKALDLFPEYHAARYLRGRCYLTLDEHARARGDLNACLNTTYRERAQKALNTMGK